MLRHKGIKIDSLYLDFRQRIIPDSRNRFFF
jgi:hypothetical protein